MRPLRFALTTLAFAASPALLATDLAPGRDVVISEVSYNPPDSLGPDSLFEFVEVHNRGAAPVDASGWRLKDRDDLHTFTLPADTAIPPGGHLVIARDCDALRQVYTEPFECAGGAGFALGNDGDTVRLLDAGGVLADEVTFMDRSPWPVAADGEGSTLERISLDDDATDFTNFAASAPASPPGTPGRSNSRAGSIPARHSVVIDEIMYNPVKDPAGDPLRHCPGEEFVELFNRGAAPVDLSGWRFEKGVDFTIPEGTEIAPGAHVVLYHDRAMFEAKYGALANAMGPYAKELDDGGEELLLADSGGNPADYVDYNDAPPWPVNPDGIRGSLELADPWSDNDRGRAWRESADFKGTPGAQNSAAAAFEAAGGNAAPQITQVEARPAGEPERTQVLSTDVVLVEARVLDREGVSSARLEYQAMPAGRYIRKTDPAFAAGWTSVPMAYDPDRAVWAASIPPFPHRTLVRYRVFAKDAAASPLEAPSLWPGDPEPNHAYFVHDGVPPYVANHRSAFGLPGLVHTGLDAVPVYHIIADEGDIEAAQYVQLPIGDPRARWLVTFVHDGHVHDHVVLRLRSGHAYSWPKRPWKVRFNRGNLFDGVSNEGVPYARKRRRIHFMSAQHDADKPRGESGVFESLAWRLFREAGVIGATTTFVHLRFVRSAEELDQFLGDFFGIFLETQHVDKTCLEDNGRSVDDASTLYKFEGAPVKVHPDCDSSTDGVRAFMDGTRRATTREWWEANLDVPEYLSFRSVVDLADDHDMDSLKNFFYFFSSTTGRWEVSPWDLDNTFGADASGDEPLATKVIPLFRVEYQNRLRRLWQVQFDERRMFSIIDGWSGWIRGLADADLDRWDTEPRQACPDWPQTSGGQCRRYGAFIARMRDLKLWIRTRRSALTGIVKEPRIPATPVNANPADGWPAGAPIVLRTQPFADPDAGDLHARSDWVVIERGGDWAYPHWEIESADALTEAVVPADAVERGREYLFRAAHQDSTGRWSLLSEPTSFFAGAADATQPETPAGLAASHVGARAVELRWTPPRDLESGVFGYLVRRDGASLTRSPLREPRFADYFPPPGRKASYEVVAVNGAGLESAPSDALRIDVPPFESLAGWSVPGGGFDYFYDARPGEARFGGARSDANATNLDGAWARSRVDVWDGSRLGPGEGAPGGAEIEDLANGGDEGGPASVLAIEDPGNPAGIPGPNNSRIYLLHDAGEADVSQGATLVARLRLSQAPRDVRGSSGQVPETEAARGMVGITSEEGGVGPSFFVWLDGAMLGVPGGPQVQVAPARFVSIWATVAAEDGRHRVRVYLDGAEVPSIDRLVDLPTDGAEAAFSGRYISLGLANRSATGAIQVDWVGVKAGVHAPSRSGGSGAAFVRGDVVADGAPNLTDAIVTLRYLFTGESELRCPDAADVDDTGRVDITDAILFLRYATLGGGPPAPPWPDCGTDPTPDAMEPCSHEACGG